MQAVEGRLAQRIALKTYVMLIGTMTMVAAGAGSIWVALLRGPLS